MSEFRHLQTPRLSLHEQSSHTDQPQSSQVSSSTSYGSSLSSSASSSRLQPSQGMHGTEDLYLNLSLVVVPTRKSPAYIHHPGGRAGRPHAHMRWDCWCSGLCSTSHLSSAHASRVRQWGTSGSTQAPSRAPRRPALVTCQDDAMIWPEAELRAVLQAIHGGCHARVDSSGGLASAASTQMGRALVGPMRSSK